MTIATLPLSTRLRSVQTLLEKMHRHTFNKSQPLPSREEIAHAQECLHEVLPIVTERKEQP